MQKQLQQPCTSACQLCSGQIWDEPVVPDCTHPIATMAKKSDSHRKRLFSPTNVIFGKYCSSCFLDLQKLSKRQRQMKNNLVNQKKSDETDVTVADIHGDKIDMNMSIDQEQSVG